MQAYDIVSFTESWLTQQIRNDGTSIPNFNPSYRNDRSDGHGVESKFTPNLDLFGRQV